MFSKRDKKEEEEGIIAFIYYFNLYFIGNLM